MVVPFTCNLSLIMFCFFFVLGNFQASKSYTWGYPNMLPSSMMFTDCKHSSVMLHLNFIHFHHLNSLQMQFSNIGPLEQHGFARNRFWSIDTDPPPFPTNSCNKAFVDLILKPSEEDMKVWPHRYAI